MSKALVPPNPDKAKGVVDSVKHDGITVAIVMATAVGHAVIPVFGWAVLLAGGVALGYRAVKRGLKNR